MDLQKFRNLSKPSKYAIVGVVILFGGLMVTINFSLQRQDGRSRADTVCTGNVCVINGGGSGGWYPTPTTRYYPTPTRTPTPWYPTPTKVPTPTPTRIPTVTPTKIPTPTLVIPTATKIPSPTVGVATVPTNTPTPTQQPTPTSVPTSTPVPGATKFVMDLLLHGVGRGGDSVNPTGQGNFNLLRPQRNATIQVYDDQNHLVLSKQGAINFDNGAGSFKGTIDMGTALKTGSYIIKVKLPQYLLTTIPGRQTITAGSTNIVPSTVLITGDINGDNSINILDYNTLTGCYSDFLPPVSCTTTNQSLSDLTDDGDVNQFDYNLFLRELRGGQ